MLNKLFILVGPSGAGKSAVTDELEKLCGYKPVWSYTTRPPRFPGEPNHTFVTQAEFDAIRDNEGLVAYTHYDGYDYGVPRSMLNACDMYVVDPRGIMELKKRYYGDRPWIVVGLSISEEERTARMRRRGDTEEMIAQRIIQDRKSFNGFEGMCDYVVHAEAPLADVVAMVQEIIARETS